MTTRRTTSAALAGLAAMALLAAGCSSSSPHAAAPAHKTASTDQDAGSAPGVAVPGGDGDGGDEAAAINPKYANGVANKSLQITGYTAQVDVLSLPNTHATRAPWREMPKPHPIKGGDNATTSPAQNRPPKGTPPPLEVNVAGLDYASWGAGHPPDTSGAVGPKQFVQTVNTSIGVYSKTGTQLNAFTFNTFFGQFHSGTPCDNQNGGDPQVIFDRPANKWIIGDLSYPGPYYFCMAVSAGPNITGKKWTLYPYLASQTELNDYPKIASGPNGLFLTSNMFLNGQSFDGAEVWALERSSLGAKKLNVQTVRTSSRYGSLLPANSYAAAESSGPEELVSLESSTSVGVWQYDVNWATPSKTTFTQTPALVAVRPYQPAGSVAQRTGSPLDSLSDRPMYQLQKATDGTLWFNSSVQVGTQAGVRWYQLGDVDSATPKVIRQSTFAPHDGLSRWMGSLAVDKNGDMAVGYSTSSSATYPSINYATRTPSNGRNRLTTEGTIATGTGSQTGISRWGDYSQMSIDPTNGCTFWYTQEYYLVTGADWQTRIASFTFPGCS